MAVTGWTAPALEVEVAVRVGDGAEVAGLAPALELVDIDLPFDDLEPILAGNVCHRGVVFGDEVPGVDPWAIGVAVTKAGVVVAEGRLTEDPRTAAVVRSFLAGHGAALEPGRPDHRRVHGGSGGRGARRRARASRSGPWATCAWLRQLTPATLGLRPSSGSPQIPVFPSGTMLSSS